MRRALLRMAGPLLLLGAVLLLLPLHAVAADKPAGDAPLKVTYYYLPG